ncbi:hypothetical protein GCM10010530_31470 [Kribbella aluminosa]
MGDCGASGFLLKDVAPEHLTAAVRLVTTGDALLAPSITRRLVERFATPQPAPHRELSTLTPRELEVLTLMGQGLSNAGIATALTLSEATVKPAPPESSPNSTSGTAPKP